MNILKSIGAVLAGFISVAVLSVATDYLLETLGIFPAPSEQGLFITWMLALALFYRSAYAIVGGYITARLAPQNPKGHVITLAILGFIGGVVGVVAGWNLSDHWYPIALALTGPAFVWLGGWLKIKNS